MQGRDGTLRILDGRATPYFLQVPFVNMNFTGPAGRARPPEEMVPSLGGAFSIVSDLSPMFEGQPFSFTCWVEDTVHIQKLRDSLSNLDLKSPWTVAGSPWTNARAAGSIRTIDGGHTQTSPFHDSLKVAVNLELLWTARRSLVSNVGVRYSECYIPPQEVTYRESADAI